MNSILNPLFSALLGLLKSRAVLHLENLALLQQLAMVVDRDHKRIRFHRRERVFWVLLFRCWSDCLQTIRVFQPDTLLRWHRKGFRFYWRWKSHRGRGGRLAIEPGVRQLIKTMSRDNVGWGAPRIRGELKMSGIYVSQATVAKYMVRSRKPPSQTWKTFLDNPVPDMVSVDIFTVPTATFRILYVFLVLRHDRRKVANFNVTESPTAQWTAQQVVEAFPFDTAPRYLLRDRDSIYSDVLCRRVKSLGIEEVLTAPRSPWPSPYVERLIVSIRCECLNHVIVLNEFHLRRQLRSYITYYHDARTHLGLAKQCPKPRSIYMPDQGHVVAFPHVGGLHHEYRRVA